MLYSAIDIAKWFIVRSNSDYNIGCTDELISNLKLQKLLYYAQGCVLALTDKPLFKENIMAWEHGPVVAEVYQTFKSFEGKGISLSKDFDINIIDEGIRNILESVYTEFGQYSAWKLRNMTHEEEPWKQTKKNNIISNDLIKSFFIKTYIE